MLLHRSYLSSAIAGTSRGDNKNDNNSSKENDKLNNDKLIDIEHIKQKKNVKIFDKSELKLMKIINSKSPEQLHKEEKLFLTFQHTKSINSPTRKPLSENNYSNKHLAENNVILTRAHINPSAKQMEYINQIKETEDTYMYLLLKKYKTKHHESVNQKQIIKKLKQYQEYAHKLQLQKIKEKLMLVNQHLHVSPLQEANEDKLFLKDDIEEKIYINYTCNDNTERSSYKYKKRKLTFYDKIWNCCCRNPSKPYAFKKRIWIGEYGVFKKEFQDNRDYI